MFHRPSVKTYGYVLAVGAATGMAVAGGILPAYMFPWWIDQLGHFAGGIALALWLRIAVNPRWVIVIVVILSVGWEATEWTIGTPFHVTPFDTKLDLLAGWGGTLLALSLTLISRDSSLSNQVQTVQNKRE